MNHITLSEVLASPKKEIKLIRIKLEHDLIMLKSARNFSKQCPCKSIKGYICGRSVNTWVNAISRLCSLLALSYCQMLLCVLTTPLLFTRFRNLPSCLQNLAKSQEESSKLTFFVLQKLVPLQTKGRRRTLIFYNPSCQEPITWGVQLPYHCIFTDWSIFSLLFPQNRSVPVYMRAHRYGKNGCFSF